MRIGIDFDNTIVCYTGLFYRIAVAQGLIPDDIDQDKQSVRDYLRGQGENDVWTRLQGVVYGEKIKEAGCFKGVFDFMKNVLSLGHEVFIVSHKTQYPVIGKKNSLHDAARQWLTVQGVFGSPDEGGVGLPIGNAFFEVTKELKLKRIGDLKCDLFFDDLPEFLCEASFPVDTKKILFDPYKKQNHTCDTFVALHTWADADQLILEKKK